MLFLQGHRSPKEAEPRSATQRIKLPLRGHSFVLKLAASKCGPSLLQKGAIAESQEQGSCVE